MSAHRILRSRDGALTVPMLLCLGVVVAAGFGVWGLMRHWRKTVELQLRLDECVGSLAVELRSTLSDLQSQNTRLRALRTTFPAVVEMPVALAALRTAMAVTVAQQEVTRIRWQARRVTWLTGMGAGAGCRGRGDLPLPLPDLPWRRGPADAVGPQPLEWTASPTHVFHIELHHPPRYSAARVETSPAAKEGVRLASLVTPYSWHAKWEPALSAFRPGSH